MSSSASAGSDLFSQEVFVELLRNPKGAQLFGHFLKLDQKESMLRFWTSVNQFRSAPKLDKKRVGEIYFNFIHDGGDEQVELAEEVRNETIEQLKSPSQTMFDTPQQLVTEQMYLENYREFVRYIVQKKAQNQLRNVNRAQRGEGLLGLGDCFCLSDPSQEDNPIIGASEGFIKVTGYSRAEVIGKNCRFLQGEGTDRQSVSNIRDAIKAQAGITEILLNYKKDGTPFWNLLFVCPLFDAEGTLRYYIGGQVDITRNVGNVGSLQALLKLDRPNLLKKIELKLRKGQKVAGAETSIMDATLSVDVQKKIFTETYSSFLVFEASSFAIQFVSAHFLRMFGLNQADLQTKTIEPLFGKWTEKKPLQDLRTAFQRGLAESQTVVLYDQSSNPQKVHTHLTPVKDQEAKTTFVVAVVVCEKLNQKDVKRLSGLTGRKFLKKDDGCTFQWRERQKEQNRK